MKAFYAILLLYFAAVHSFAANDTIKDVKTYDNENLNSTMHTSPSMPNSTVKTEGFTNHSQSKNSTVECDQQQNSENNSTLSDCNEITFSSLVLGLHLCHYVFYSVLELLTIATYKTLKDKVASSNARWYLLYVFMAIYDLAFFLIGSFLMDMNVYRAAVITNYAVVVELGWIVLTESYTVYSLMKKYGYISISAKVNRVKNIRMLTVPLIGFKLFYLLWILWPSSFAIFSGYDDFTKVSGGVLVALEHLLIPALVQILFLCLFALLYDLGLRHHTSQEDRMMSRFGNRFRDCLGTVMLTAGSVLAQFVALRSCSYFTLLVCLNCHMAVLLMFVLNTCGDAKKRSSKIPSPPKTEAQVEQAVQP